MSVIDQTDPSPREDPMGHQLFSQRCETARNQFQLFLESWHSSEEIPEADQKLLEGGLVATGTGSSEAHAKFLAEAGKPVFQGKSEFLPLSSFLEKKNLAKENTNTLVIFSQGLSPNSWFALEAAPLFRKAFLFSATDPNEESQKGEVLRKFLRNGGVLIPIPMRNEYTLLIRVVGPLIGFAAGLKLLKCISGTTHFDPPEKMQADLDAAAKWGETSFEAVRSSILKNGRVVCLALPPWPDLLKNISFKFLEGLFLPCPTIWDPFQYSHGPFQEVRNKEIPHFIFLDQSGLKSLLNSACHELIQKLNAPHQTFVSQNTFPWGILEMEVAMNSFLQEAIPSLNINQVEWPGKGEDGPLYSFSTDTFPNQS